MTDEAIAQREYLNANPGALPISIADWVIAALAAARKDERQAAIAECVRRLKDAWLNNDDPLCSTFDHAARWLEAEMAKS